MSHTKGPWVAKPQYGAVKSGNITVAMVDNHYVPAPGHGFPNEPTERDANAALIESAPDLLAACKASLALPQVQEELRCLDKGIGVNTRDRVWLDMRNAVARAEGRQP